MVRHYRVKSNKCSYTEGQVQLAIENIVKNDKSVNSSAKDFQVPLSTLQTKFKKFLDPEDGDITKKKSSGFKKTFSDDQEMALCQYIIKMQRLLLGLSSKEVRRLAFDFAEKLGLDHNFNVQEGLAGKDWLHNFMKRHELSCRKAEHTSKQRALGFNEENVADFFKLLAELNNEYNFKPENIYNVDETGISVVPKTGSVVLAPKGEKQVGGLSAAERGKTVTAELCMSATGKFMPPMLIFPRKKENSDYSDGAPPGAWAEFHQSGWIQEDIFTKWLKKFIEFSNPSVENPVLLILDGHATHVKNLEVIDLAIDNHVVILCLPPHCTHKMQPLDKTFMKPLSTFYSQEVIAFQREGITKNKDKKPNVMTLRTVFKVFGKAFEQAKKEETAKNGFQCTGIYPLNPNVFTKADFVNSRMNSSSGESTTETGSNTLVDNYTRVIEEIQSPASAQPASTASGSTQPLPTLFSSPPQNMSTLNSVSSPSGEISIPVSYLLQAKPLLKFLSSSLSSIGAELVSPTSNDFSASTGGTVSHSNAIPTSTSSTSTLFSGLQNSVLNSKGASLSMSEENDVPCDSVTISKDETSNVVTSINIASFNINCPKAIPKSRKGKTAVVTAEDYRNELMVQKLKNIKKEPKSPKRKNNSKTLIPKENKQPQMVSNVPANFKLPKPSNKKNIAVLKNNVCHESLNTMFNLPFMPQSDTGFMQEILLPLNSAPVEYVEVPYGNLVYGNKVVGVPLNGVQNVEYS